jgi:hypothetical protein
MQNENRQTSRTGGRRSDHAIVLYRLRPAGHIDGRALLLASLATASLRNDDGDQHKHANERHRRNDDDRDDADQRQARCRCGGRLIMCGVRTVTCRRLPDRCRH